MMRRGAVAFAALAAVLSVLFYRDFVFHPERMLFGTDMLLEGHPLRGFALEEVRAGRGLPGWNPFLNAGHPFLATLPGPLFYPSSLLYLVLPLHRAIGWTFVLHGFLAGIFGYFAGRSFRLGREASALVGLSFMFSGYLLSTLYGGHDGRMFALTLVPLALGFLERGLRGGRTGWFVGLGVVIAFQIFTPHTQMMYFSSLLLVAYAGFRILTGGPGRGLAAGRTGPKDGGSRPERWAALARPAGLLVLAFAVAAAIGAVQLLPTYLLLEHVVRAAAEEGYEFAASWALPPAEVTALVLPDLMGSLGTYWGTNPFKLHSEYLGAVPVALATVAVASSFQSGKARQGGEGRARRRHTSTDPGVEPGSGDGHSMERSVVWFLAGAFLLGVLFALGGATPVHRLAYAVVPMMDSFRAPSMMLGPVSVLVALLAGAGWQRIRSPERDLPWLAVLLASAPFLLLGLAALLAPRGLLTFVYHSWLPEGWPRTPPAELEGALRISGGLLVTTWLAVLGAARGLRAKRIGAWVVLPLMFLLVGDLWRVDARYLRTAEAADELAPPPGAQALAEALRPGERAWPVEGAVHPNELMRSGVPVLNGTQKFLLEGYARLVGGVGQENLLRHPTLWGLFDLRVLLARSELETPLLERLEIPGLGARAYEPAARRPHAYFPSRVRAARSPAEALRGVLALEDPGAEALVEAEEAPPAGSGTARVSVWEADDVVLEVSAQEAGLLFVSELWAPGWKVTVDDREERVYRTNVAFRGVRVPAGDHRVRFVYRTPGFRTGRTVSLVALVLVAGFLGGAWVVDVRCLRGDGR